jgi:hypothetical protein
MGRKLTADELLARAQERRDHRWEELCGGTYKGRLTGNAKFAQECRNTPLEAQAILDLVWGNVGYFGDGYYRPLTEPIEMRVEEFYAHIGKQEPTSG